MYRSVIFILLTIVASSCGDEGDPVCGHYFLREARTSQGSALYYYNANGKVSTIENKETPTTDHTDFSYDDAGNLTDVVHFSTSGQLKSRFYFNENGQFVTSVREGIDSLLVHYNPDGTVSRTDTYQNQTYIQYYRLYTYPSANTVRVETYLGKVEDHTQYDLQSTADYTLDGKQLPFPPEVNYDSYSYTNIILPGNATLIVITNNDEIPSSTTIDITYNAGGFPLTDNTFEYVYTCEPKLK